MFENTPSQNTPIVNFDTIRLGSNSDAYMGDVVRNISIGITEKIVPCFSTVKYKIITYATYVIEIPNIRVEIRHFVTNRPDSMFRTTAMLSELEELNIINVSSISNTATKMGPAVQVRTGRIDNIKTTVIHSSSPRCLFSRSRNKLQRPLYEIQKP
jgi:hypothetical protein